MKRRGRETVFFPQADWVRLIEAFGAPIEDDPSWARAVLEAAAPSFRCQAGFALYVLEENPDQPLWNVPLSVGIGGAKEFSVSPEGLGGTPAEVFNVFHHSIGLVGTQEGGMSRLSEAGREFIKGYRRHFGHADGLGMTAKPEPGCSITLTMELAETTILTPYERRLLSQVALHLESAYRLRRHPETIRAILTPGGKLVHREGPDLGAGALAERVSRIERSRTRSARRQPEALDLWDALVEGEASVVERLDGGKRYYVVFDNPPSGRKHRALSRREAEVVRMAARGLPAKLIAYGLGMAPSAVSGALARAATKLGLASRLGLVRASSLLLDTPLHGVDPGKLTESEHAIFELVRTGLSNEEIARRRSRSVRTIANQIGSILRKTNAPSRRALVTAKTAAKTER